jgi:hypothetical protein
MDDPMRVHCTYFKRRRNIADSVQLLALPFLFSVYVQIGIECELSAEELVQEIQQTLL